MIITKSIDEMLSFDLPQLPTYPGTAIRLPDTSALKAEFTNLPGTCLKENGEIDVLKTVGELCDVFTTTRCFPPTPLYRYELLDQALPYDVHLKLDNLQRFGDVQARAFASIVLLSHAAKLGATPAAAGVPEHIVLAASPANYSSRLFLQEITLVARHLGCRVSIYVSLHGLTLWDLYQLYNCRQVGADVHWVSLRGPAGASPADDEVSAAVWAAAAAAPGSTLVNPVYDRQYAMLGIATACAEMLAAHTTLSQIVVPVRHYSTGWSTLAGTALYAAEAAAARGAPIVVTAAQMRDDLTFTDNGGENVRRQALFSDVNSRMWLTNRRAEACPEATFEAWDADGDGEITRNELMNVLRFLGAPLEREARILRGVRGLSAAGTAPAAPAAAAATGVEAAVAAAVAAVKSDRHQGIVDGASVVIVRAAGAAEPAPGAIRNPAVVAVDEVVDEDTTIISDDDECLLLLVPFLTDTSDSSAILSTFRTAINTEAEALAATCRSALPDFHAAVALSALKFHGLVHAVVNVTEDESAAAFLAMLTHTHTHVSGRGAAAAASALSGRLRAAAGEQVGVLVSGGTVDPQMLDRLLDHALRQSGQIHEAEVTLPCDMSYNSALLGLVKKCACSVLRINTAASSDTPLPLGHTRVRITLVADSVQRIEELQNLILAHGWSVSPLLGKPELAALAGWRGIGPANSSDLPPIRFSTSCDIKVNPTSAPSTPSSGPYTFVSPLKHINDVTVDGIDNALRRLRDSGSIWRTMCYRSSFYSRVAGCDVNLILENTQKTGSFKIRGSSNTLIKALELGQRPPGVVACSAGNHAQGVAYTCARLGIPCTIVCPSYAPLTKLAATKRYGAEVIAVGDSFEDAAAYATQLTNERGWFALHPYASLDVIEGQGTIAAELAEQIPDLDTVLVNVGGGGLISGIAIYLKKLAAANGRKVRVIGVQAASVAPLVGSEDTGTLKYVPPNAQTLADGVNVKVPGSAIHDEVLFSLVDEYVAVPENEIAATIAHGLLHTRTLCEGAGVLGIAALIYGRVKVRPDEKVAVVSCGGNIDIQRFRQVTEFGYRALGRALSITVDVPDSPGALLRVMDAAASNTVHVRRVHHQRATECQWTQARLSIDLWSGGFGPQNRFLADLVRAGMQPTVVGRSAIPDEKHVYAKLDEELAEAARREAEKTAQASKAFNNAEAERHARRLASGVTLEEVCSVRTMK